MTSDGWPNTKHIWHSALRMAIKTITKCTCIYVYTGAKEDRTSNAGAKPLAGAIWVISNSVISCANWLDVYTSSSLQVAVVLVVLYNMHVHAALKTITVP